ncbi:MAG: hypothetical protein ACPG5B_09635 [Chitinophagales bacterium]
MKSRKYIQLLFFLDKKERKQFRLYLESPFFNKRKSILQLFDFIEKYSPTYENKKLTKEKAFLFIFPEKKYREQTFKNLMSELTRMLEDFLVQQEFAKRKKEHDYFLLDALYKKSADKFFSQKIESLQAANTDFQNAAFYEHQYTLDKFAYGFQVARKSRLAHTNLQNLIKNLDCFYLADKLKYYCVILNRQSIVSDKIDVFLPKEILQYVEKGNFEDIPAVILYYRLLLLLISEKEEEEKQYWNLKKTLEKFENALPLSELQQLYTAVFNYCNKKLKQGKTHFLQEIFDWYRVMLRKGSLITNGQITPYIHFRNIAMAGLRLGQLEWTAQFIEDYESYIAKEFRQNMVLYCRAALFFYKKDYATSLEYLAQFELKDFFYYIEHKLLLIKVYFELGEDEALENLLHSFRIYLHRTSNLATHLKQSYHNFTRLTEKLYKAQFTPNFNAQQLHDEIVETSPLTDKEWLLEKNLEEK